MIILKIIINARGNIKKKYDNSKYFSLDTCIFNYEFGINKINKIISIAKKINILLTTFSINRHQILPCTIYHIIENLQNNDYNDDILSELISIIIIFGDNTDYNTIYDSDSESDSESDEYDCKYKVIPCKFSKYTMINILYENFFELIPKMNDKYIEEKLIDNITKLKHTDYITNNIIYGIIIGANNYSYKIFDKNNIPNIFINSLFSHGLMFSSMTHNNLHQYNAKIIYMCETYPKIKNYIIELCDSYNNNSRDCIKKIFKNNNCEYYYYDQKQNFKYFLKFINRILKNEFDEIINKNYINIETSRYIVVKC